jgi:hypothetical protein
MKRPRLLPEVPLQRLKSSFDAFQNRIGERLPFGVADIRFMWIAAAASALYGAALWFGARSGTPRLLAAAPLLLVVTGYVAFMAYRVRRKLLARAEYGQNYQLSVTGLAIVLGAVFPLRLWTLGLEATGFRFDRIILLVCGGILLVAAAFPFSFARAYRRTTLLFAGLMMAGLGILIPHLSQDKYTLAACGWATLVFGGAALIMRHFLKRQVRGRDERNEIIEV